MRIVLFAHPPFMASQSMPRFAAMLEQGMRKRGHHVERWTASPRAFHLPSPRAGKKWLGYIDQYLLFPTEVSRRLEYLSPDTLFVFADHALGPWIPLVKNRPHVIHCHDFLAQKSALREIQENLTGWSGRLYQKYIRNGYTKGENFISVSEKTRQDLHRFLDRKPDCSEVVYNGLNQAFVSHDPISARSQLGRQIGRDFTKGYLLHVGGNQWYKNRVGVIEIYDAWRGRYYHRLPLILIGPSASTDLLEAHSKSAYREDIHLLSGLEDSVVQLAYSGASVFLFPSLAEGFGWPIAEAMASGCPVITTGEAPMTEVAGGAAALIPRRAPEGKDAGSWARQSAEIVEDLLSESRELRLERVKKGIENVRRFDSEEAIDRIETIYRQILERTG